MIFCQKAILFVNITIEKAINYIWKFMPTSSLVNMEQFIYNINVKLNVVKKRGLSSL